MTQATESHTTTPATRRRLLALGTMAAAAALPVAAIAGLGAPHADAALLALEPTIQGLFAQFIAACHAEDAAQAAAYAGRCDAVASMNATRAMLAASDRLYQAVSVMVHTTATTPDGLFAKARAAWVNPDEVDVAIAESIARDLLAMDGLRDTAGGAA